MDARKAHREYSEKHEVEKRLMSPSLKTLSGAVATRRARSTRRQSKRRKMSRKRSVEEEVEERAQWMPYVSISRRKQKRQWNRIHREIETILYHHGRDKLFNWFDRRRAGRNNEIKCALFLIQIPFVVLGFLIFRAIIRTLVYPFFYVCLILVAYLRMEWYRYGLVIEDDHSGSCMSAFSW